MTSIGFGFPLDNQNLLSAFPSSIRPDVQAALRALPPNPHYVGAFCVRLNQEQLTIPERVYHDTRLIATTGLTDPQRAVVDCILTRHNDGHVRQKHLGKIVSSNEIWVVPYVVGLTGEYVIEILQDIEKGLNAFDQDLYGSFLRENPEFLNLISHQVSSYWDCYYRSHKKNEYVGFRILHALQEMANRKQ